MDWSGLLWCFYQLFGLSFWRHPFTTEHPLLRHWCNAIWWRNKLIYFLEHIFSKSYFCVNYSFNTPPQSLEFDQMSVTSSLNNEHIQQNNRAGLWAAHASARGGSHQWTGTILSANWIFVYATLLLLRWIRFALLCGNGPVGVFALHTTYRCFLFYVYSLKEIDWIQCEIGRYKRSCE